MGNEGQPATSQPWGMMAGRRATDGRLREAAARPPPECTRGSHLYVADDLHCHKVLALAVPALQHLEQQRRGGSKRVGRQALAKREGVLLESEKAVSCQAATLACHLWLASSGLKIARFGACEPVPSGEHVSATTAACRCRIVAVIVRCPARLNTAAPTCPKVPSPNFLMILKRGARFSPIAN